MTSRKPCVLVVDDDGGTRSVVRRSLIREFDVSVIEAADGLTALQKIASDGVDLVIVDLSMPLLDGFDTIEVIRHSPFHARLPIVVMSGVTSPSFVQRSLELGVDDFLAKPVHLDNLKQRCAPFLLQARLAGEAESDVLHLSSTSRVLIVESAPEYRRFLSDVFRQVCQVEETDSALDALRRCLLTPPSAVVLGRADGLMDDEFLERKHRETSELHRVQLLRFVDVSEELRERPDEVAGAHRLPRTLDAPLFLEGLRRCVGDETFAQILLGPASPCLDHFFEASASLFAAALCRPVQPTPLGEMEPSRRQRHVVVTIEMHIGHLRTELRLFCAYSVGVHIVGMQMGIPEDRIPDHQISAAVGEVLLSASRGLASTLEPYGLEPAFGRPNASWLAPGHTDMDAPRTVSRWFATEDRMLTLRLAHADRRLRAPH